MLQSRDWKRERRANRKAMPGKSLGRKSGEQAPKETTVATRRQQASKLATRPPAARGSLTRSTTAGCRNKDAAMAFEIFDESNVCQIIRTIGELLTGIGDHRT